MTTRAVAIPHGARGHARLGLERARAGVWVFLGSECIVFGALIGTYLGLYGRSVSGPGPHQALHVPTAAAATYLLLSSGLAMALAALSARRGQVALTRVYLALTILLGGGFLGIQASEYLGLVRDGLTPSTNVFGGTFFLLTGLHGTHVLVGLIWLAGVLVNSLRGRITAENAGVVDMAGLYWAFVDMVWMIIFPIVYLMEFMR